MLNEIRKPFLFSVAAPLVAGVFMMSAAVLGQDTAAADASRIIGSWRITRDKTTIGHTFAADGTMTTEVATDKGRGNASGTWTLEGAKLSWKHLKATDPKDEGVSTAVIVKSVDDKQMVLLDAESPARTMTLARVNPAINENPTDPAFTVLARIENGLALIYRREGFTTGKQVLEAAMAALKAFCGSTPQVTQQKSDSNQNAVAAFVVTRKQEPMTGVAFGGVGPKGAAALIVLNPTRGTRQTFVRLVNEAKAALAGPAELKQADVPLKTFNFPDGTGAIGLPEGWSTASQSLGKTVAIKGPEDQSITINLHLTIMAPNRLVAVDPRKQLCGPFCQPEQAVPLILNQSSRLNAQRGGDTMAVEYVKRLDAPPVQMINGPAQYLEYGLVRHHQGKDTERKAVALIGTAQPPGLITWQFHAYTEMAANAQTFERDLPVMLAIMRSIQSNDAALAAQSRAASAAADRRFRASQQAHKELVKAQDDYMASLSRNQDARDRAVANWSDAAILNIDRKADPYDSTRELDIPTGAEKVWINPYGRMECRPYGSSSPAEDPGNGNMDWRQVQ